jgi:hypothetical protein
MVLLITDPAAHVKNYQFSSVGGNYSFIPAPVFRGRDEVIFTASGSELMSFDQVTVPFILFPGNLSIERNRHILKQSGRFVKTKGGVKEENGFLSTEKVNFFTPL